MSDGEYRETKTVKPFGNRAHAVLPKELINELVFVAYPVDENGLNSPTKDDS